MLKDDLRQILTDLLPELNAITIQFMNAAGTPRSSDLSKSTKFINTENGIALEANYYFQYDDSGRRRGVRKVPITALIQYIKDRGIVPRGGQTINQLAFAIQTSIYRNGIGPKNYFDRIEKTTTDVTEEVVADKLIIDIADEVVDVMLQSPYATETT